MTVLLGGVFPLAAPEAVAATSIYPLRPDDPQAVYLTPQTFAVHADGRADDTAALQAAINRVQETTRRGIVFVPSGRYRLTKTIHVWSGIRLIGYGPTRPVLLLAPSTPGFQQGSSAYLVHFVSERPDSPDEPIRDANPGTFYSAMSNIDIVIGDGNPAAVGVRAHFAQHCFLAHMDFHVGNGRAGVEEVGNLFEHVRFFGGEFGITMHKPSPSWPFVLLDATFTGQRRAAIETEEGGLTIIRVQVSNVPTVVLVRPDRCEELWIEDSRFENVSGPAIVISDEHSARTQINLQNVTCERVPHFAHFRESGRDLRGRGEHYVVENFCHGLHLTDDGSAPKIKTTFAASPRAAAEPGRDGVALAAIETATLPPMKAWVNLRALGAAGDGVTDDTAALRAAIAQHDAIYLPSGRYRVTDTIELRRDTALIGLNPITTQIVLADDTPAFQGAGAPVPLLATPPGGTNIVTGIGLDTNGVNPRAVALKWRAGPRSLLADVRFLGGHGTYGTDGRYLKIYNDHRTADPDPRRRWDSQHASLWVTDGGGGTFQNIWTPSPYASAGLYVSNTETPGRVLAMSSEHHVRNEVKLRRVAHWRFYGLQTEAERAESPHALPLEIQDSHDLLFANCFLYRVDLSVPYPTGIRVTRSRRLDFRGVHVYSPGKLSYDNTLTDPPRGIQVRSREIAWLHVSGKARSRPAEPGPRVTTIARGFTNIDGLVADARGGVAFVDQAWHRIHHWSAEGGVSVVTDAIPRPVALAFDQAGNLLIVSREGRVFALPPGGDDDDIIELEPRNGTPPRKATCWLPVNRWRDGHDWLEANLRREPLHYLSPDGTVAIPAPPAFVELAQSGRPWGTVDLARTYALAPARAGAYFYVADEFGQTTWRFTAQPDGTLGEPYEFAQEGEAGTALDADGNVYVCAGHVFVYAPDGRCLDVIETLERPSAVVFGGVDRRTLFIAARSSLYAVRPTIVAR